MPYRFLDDIATADVAFEAAGKTLEEVFAASAEAVLNVMVEEPDRVERKEAVSVQLANESLEMLLYDFLSEIVFLKDAKRLLLRVDGIRIAKADAAYNLRAELSGEALEPLKHPLGADVKAVTLHRFSLNETEDGWKATVVLDI